MAAPRVSFSDKDLENGAPGNQDRAASRKWSTAPGNIEDLDEYTALQKYISTYRDPKAAAEDDGKNAADAKKGKAWWQFWRSGSSKQAATGDPGTVPDEWLDADIKQGITNNDVESRRKRFGFNEITTEKENLFIKFLMFFTGPILYGKQHFRLSISDLAAVLFLFFRNAHNRRRRIGCLQQSFPRSKLVNLAASGARWSGSCLLLLLLRRCTSKTRATWSPQPEASR